MSTNDECASSPLNTKLTGTRTRDVSYTLDVLTDGSEQSGPPTLFLSVYKPGVPLDTSSQRLLQLDNESSDALQSRYAVKSLGDLLSRAASDQRYKLHAVRAVFCQEPDMIALQGLPSLLMVLHQAGKPDLTIVASERIANRIDNIVHMMHKYKQHPLVQICRVPSGEKKNERNTISWWSVYKDDFLLVHATTSFTHRRKSDDDSISYLYTLRKLSSCGRKRSLLMVPSAATVLDVKCLLSHLPLDEDDKPLEILAGICGSNRPVLEEGLSSSGTRVSWYSVVPHPPGIVDPGLLVRAQLQSRAFHEKIPRCFPWNDINTSNRRGETTSCATGRLCTGHSLTIVSPSERGQPPFMSVVNRLVQQGITTADDLLEPKEYPIQLDRFLSALETKTVEIKDQDEIDLDGLDEDEEADGSSKNGLPVDETEVSQPNDDSSDETKLLVLGTGCAAPSPYRGASGYVLLFKGNHSSIAFEVGEGFVTQWNRYALGYSLDSIRLIWISHSHWDHYGGLVNLLLCLHDVRTANRIHGDGDTRYSLKRARGDGFEVPRVVAPRKVLQFLKHVFAEPQNYFHGADHSSKPRTFQMYNSINTDNGLFRPICFWEDVLVDHSCHQSYGFVVGLRTGNGQVRVVCFSGDTRPCQNLVDACCCLAARYGQGRVDLLIHEATFDQNEKDMSVSKKHSTVREALDIAEKTNSKRTLLTHFSQRYSQNDFAAVTGCVGFAVDGLLFPL